MASRPSIRTRVAAGVAALLLLAGGVVAVDALAAEALTNVASLGGGGGHTLAVKKDGRAWAWGYNSQGQVGNGKSGVSVLYPTKVKNLTGVSAVAGGEFHTLALKKDGTVFSWGENDKGQLGTGSPGSNQTLPTEVRGLSDVKAIDADGDRSYAVLSDGRVRAWGANDSGQLGNGSTQESGSPGPVSGLKDVTAVAAGGAHTLALTSSGTVFGWGQDRYGQVGDGRSCNAAAKTGCNRLTPVASKGLDGKATAIAAGQLGDYSLALMSDGTVMSWGRNDQGQLGQGTKTTSGCKCATTPGKVKGLSSVKAIAASGGAGAALRSDGSVWVWGNDKYGQQARGSRGSDTPTPHKVAGLSGVKALTGGGGYFLALKSDGSVVGWGINGFGELGVGTTTEAITSPVAIGVTQAADNASFNIDSKALMIVAIAAALLISVFLITRFRGRREPAYPPYYGDGGAWATGPWQGHTATGMPVLMPPHGASAGLGAAGLGRPPTENVPGTWEEYGRRIRLLSRVDLFEGVSPDVLAHVATVLKPMRAGAGEVVSREDDIGDQFFIVEAGTLAITTEIGGEDRELARIGPGEFFGEGALLGQGRGSATIAAVTDAELWTLAATDLKALVAEHPELDRVVRHVTVGAGVVQTSGTFDVEQRSMAELAQAGKTIRIGRSPENDLVFPSPLVSREHAVIESVNDTFRIRDLGSQNGTFVNGTPVRSALLSDGDEVWVGDQRFIFDRRAIHRSVEPRGVRLDASGLSTVVGDEVTLLHDVDLSILPGELVAVVGGSGSGKTTLMGALSGVRPPTSGRVLYNGRDYYANLAFFRNVLGYVPQDDIIHTDLPVRRTLWHAAQLRLPHDTSAEDVDAAVDGALEDLELTARKDVQVGLLSGGQRKRCSIGVELLTQPRIFFLDEPTSGLDPYTDAQMMRLLRRLADRGSTVVLTTHATLNVMLCDKVVFLARGGHLAFVGTPRRALRYFEADTFEAIYEQLAEQASPEDWSAKFRDSEDRRQLLADQVRPEETGLEPAKRASLSERAPGGRRRVLHQLKALSRRNLDVYRQNPKNLPSLIMPPILFTLLALALFPSDTFSSNENSAACLQMMFLLAFSGFIFGLLFSVQEIVREVAIFQRERMVNVGIVPYVLSKSTFLAPLLALLLTLMVVVLRITGRLPSSGFDVYWKLDLTVVLTGLVGLSLGLLTSAVVRNSQQATDALSVWIMPQVLFGGALLAVPAMNLVGQVISAVAPVRWSFEALGHIVDLDTLFRTDTSRVGAGLAIQYEDSFTRDPVQNWAILVAFLVIATGLTCQVLKMRSAPARAKVKGGRVPAPAAAPAPRAAPGVPLTLTIGGREVAVSGRLLVGRDPSADVVLDDPEVSARHAAFVAQNGALSVEDLGSSNGTFVNGTPLSGRKDLRPGDRIQVGGTLIEVTAGPRARA